MMIGLALDLVGEATDRGVEDEEDTDACPLDEEATEAPTDASDETD